jgi:hypothetical protein
MTKEAGQTAKQNSELLLTPWPDVARMFTELHGTRTHAEAYMGRHHNHDGFTTLHGTMSIEEIQYGI